MCRKRTGLGRRVGGGTAGGVGTICEHAGRCPECGRPFDPTKRRSYLGRPLRGPFWRWTKRITIWLLVVTLTAGGTWGWFYWGWRHEQAVIAKLRVQPWDMSTEWFGASNWPKLGAKRLQRALGPAGFVLDRVRFLNFTPRSLSRIRRLSCIGMEAMRRKCARSFLYLGSTPVHKMHDLAQLEGSDDHLNGLICRHAKVHRRRAGACQGSVKALQVLEFNDTEVTCRRAGLPEGAQWTATP